MPALDEDVWELYDTQGLDSGRTTSPREKPDKLAELQRLFLIEAAKYNVLPLDDRVAERVNSDMAGRPDAHSAATRQTPLRRHGRLQEAAQSASRTSRTP